MFPHTPNSANNNGDSNRNSLNRGNVSVQNSSLESGRSSGSSSSGPSSVTAPTISLPKGGGAIKGIGEKFAANPVTGTGSMSVPIATSPGRSGFGPQLTLSYDSGAGNGPFGFGWSLSLPTITRKTDKGLPQYNDAEESDVFMLSGAEDLVPEFKKNSAGEWVLKDGKHVINDKSRSVDRISYTIRRYRPRVEGLFARIERWTDVSDPSNVHWRSISKDNVLTLYGKDANSRIADPDNPHRIFSWLICETRDDKGNAIVYEYKAEDGSGVDVTQAHERNRSDRNDSRRTANRYLKHILYGNQTTLLNNAGQRPPFLTAAQRQNTNWMFEVVLDYGEHDVDAPKPGDPGPWKFRDDPFSTYRAGFEVRTTRLCQRVLMFHHFEGEENVGNDCLVRSTDFTYSHEENPNNASNPIYTFLHAATQTGYRRNPGGYATRSLPPVEFEYTKPIVQDIVEMLESESLENLPVGLDGGLYQWTDLHSEGIPGILTEQAEGWYYKRNVSPMSTHPVEFTPLERVATKPSLALAAGGQFMDLAGNGKLDLVAFDGPMPGLFEHDGEEGWQPFRPLKVHLNRDTRDPNLKFIDLNGDGHADVLISEDEAFVWHPSLAEEGFGPAQHVYQALDEEQGPRLVFADRTQSMFLADMSGDGLTDLVRIRNGEVAYWPNLGYGRFGPKTTMDQAPHFDQPDQFDHKRLRLADIDGSGTSDIIYLHRDGVRLYFNQSGNGWSAPQILKVFPRIDDLVTITTVDLLGNGTACLVWSSPLQGDSPQPMRYVNLMGGQKPHLLVKTINNLGAETLVHYAPSTKFYLQDKRDGKPWITKLPFPVHVVEKVTVTDKWRHTKFSTSYSYHHGYFDGIEREFRGFGRVEQLDVETYGEFASSHRNSPFISDDHMLYQPPVKSITWYHTGAAMERDKILSQFQHEYFPNWLEAENSVGEVLGNFHEANLPEPDLHPSNLNAEEFRETMRACKGTPLRQEIYELDVKALEQGAHKPVKLYSSAYHNCHIRRLQPRAMNRHAVFLVTESEAITYRYELDLRAETLMPDPRIAHTMNLNIDEYGNVRQAVAVVYPRLGRHEDATLPPGAEQLIAHVQQETHLAYTENRFTNDVTELDEYRLRVPCEVLTYELTGIDPEDQDDQASADPRDNRYFTLEEWRRFQLSLLYQPDPNNERIPVPEIPYHHVAQGTTPEKRLVEQTRMLFFQDDTTTLADPLPLGRLGRRGLPYETYTLALTDELLDSVFGDKLNTDVRTNLGDEKLSGYMSGAALATRFPGTDTAGQFWIRSGIAGFAADAAQHFYLPERYIDPFENVTTLEYDPRDLFIVSSTDPLDNTIRVTQFDFRVLASKEMQDINNNFSEVAFDVLGLPTAMVVKGKGDRTEGDTFTGFTDALANPELTQLTEFFTGNAYDETQAHTWLGNATARHVYYFGETRNPDGSITWGTHPPCACSIAREQHVAQLAPGEASRIQAGFEYSDGMGAVVVQKIQAEPETPSQPLRWIANGKTILNNKGNPVKQYEPYFSSTGHRYEEPQEEGVTPIIYYDAAGRTIRTEMPDGSYSRVEFSPWHMTAYDQNDTVLESGNAWFTAKTAATASAEEQHAAQLTAEHADTPATIFLDSLGREVISITHNRVKDDTDVLRDEKYVTFTKLDAEGKPLWIRDARGNLVMQYIFPVKPTRFADEPDQTNPEKIPSGLAPCYDIAGNLLFQHSMDGGGRWMINDAAGQPLYAWDANERADDTGALILEERLYHTRYDQLRRPLEQRLKVNDESWNVIERLIYGESQANAENKNLRGQAYQHYDSSGLITMESFDFKGNLLTVTRQLVSAYDVSVMHWPENPPQNLLEDDIYTQTTEYDALNRMFRQENWHLPDRTPAIYTPQYNERGTLASETLSIRGQITEAITDIAYNAKGQRTRILYGNGTTTRYDYDPQTFRLMQLHTTRTGVGNVLPTAPSNLSDANVVQNLYYTNDPVGNITEIHDDAYEPVFFNNQQVEPRNRYHYDAMYRLIEATGRENYQTQFAPNQFQKASVSVNFPITDQALRNYRQFYRYDAVGNIGEMRHVAEQGSWTRHYAYAQDSNRLLQTWEGTDELNAVSYDYDTHGSMLNLQRAPEEFRLRWNHDDMIHQANLGGGGQAFYNYDVGKQRTRKRIERNDSTVEERLYLGGMERYRRWRGNSLVEEIETYHLFADDQRVLIVEDVLSTDNSNLDVGAVYRYQYSNHLGSVGLELDANVAIVSYEEYHPYGTTAYRTTNASLRTTAKRYRFTGMERDEESGLNYHSARYYAGWLGRWVTVDPAGLVDGLNLYGYAKNQPSTILDINGKQSDSTPRAVVVKAALGFVAHLPHVSTAVDKMVSKDEEVISETVEGVKQIPKLVEQASNLESDSAKWLGAAWVSGVGALVASHAMTAGLSEGIVKESTALGNAAQEGDSKGVVEGVVGVAHEAAQIADAVVGIGGIAQQAPKLPKYLLKLRQGVSRLKQSFSFTDDAAKTVGDAFEAEGKVNPNLGIDDSNPELNTFTKEFLESEGTLLNQMASEMRDWIKETVRGNPHLMVGVSTTNRNKKQMFLIKVSDPNIWDKLKAGVDDWVPEYILGKRPKVGPKGSLPASEHVEISGPKELVEDFGAKGVITGTAGPACEKFCRKRWWLGEFPNVWHTNVPKQ